jgi:hypothetical protein
LSGEEFAGPISEALYRVTLPGYLLAGFVARAGSRSEHHEG